MEYPENLKIEEMAETTGDSLYSDGSFSQSQRLLSTESQESFYVTPKKPVRRFHFWALAVATLVTSNLLTAALCFTYIKNGNHLLKWTSAYCELPLPPVPI